MIQEEQQISAVMSVRSAAFCVKSLLLISYSKPSLFLLSETQDEALRGGESAAGLGRSEGRSGVKDLHTQQLQALAQQQAQQQQRQRTDMFAQVEFVAVPCDCVPVWCAFAFLHRISGTS